MSTSAPAVGSIRLSDAAVPAIEAGSYRLTSALYVERRELGRASSPLDSPPPHVIHFDVIGPRFAIDRADVVDRQPAPEAKGLFGDRLPVIVLGRRTLPWERAAPDGMPWLALLVFAGDEATLATGALSTQVPAGVVAALQAIEPFTDDPNVTVMHAKDLATFRSLLPGRNEAKLLAHVREVNLADTAMAGQDDDGVFAVVTANRLPLAGAPDGTPYTACVVSLEGRDDAWAVADGQPPPPLIVLHSWTFTSSSAGGTFAQLAAQLDVAPFGAPTAGTSAVLAADGTIAVNGVERDGTSDIARYRGPLLGLATGQPLGSATDDVSSNAAFELGRLLGASDGRFLRELVGWHRASDASARAEMVRAEITHIVSPSAPAPRSGSGGTRSAQAAMPTRAGTTAWVTQELGTLLASVARHPANLWRPHPAGVTIHAIRSGAPRESAKSSAKAKPHAAAKGKRPSRPRGKVAPKARSSSKRARRTKVRS